jgi:hypothetical protein
VPKPKHPTKTISAATQAPLTHTHQRPRVNVRPETVAALTAECVDTERSNESVAGDGLSDDAPRVGFTNNFPKEYG